MSRLENNCSRVMRSTKESYIMKRRLKIFVKEDLVIVYLRKERFPR